MTRHAVDWEWDCWTSHFHLMCGFMSLAVYLLAAAYCLEEGEKRWLSSPGQSGLADNTSRASVGDIMGGYGGAELAELVLANKKSCIWCVGGRAQ